MKIVEKNVLLLLEVSHDELLIPIMKGGRKTRTIFGGLPEQGMPK